MFCTGFGLHSCMTSHLPDITFARICIILYFLQSVGGQLIIRHPLGPKKKPEEDKPDLRKGKRAFIGDPKIETFYIWIGYLLFQNFKAKQINYVGLTLDLEKLCFSTLTQSSFQCIGLTNLAWLSFPATIKCGSAFIHKNHTVITLKA